MSYKCKCGTVQTGYDACAPIVEEITGFGLMKLYADDGTRNGIDKSVALSSTYFTGLLNSADESKKLFYFSNFENVAYLPSEVSTYTTTNGITKNNRKEGIFGFQAEFVDISISVMSAWNNGFCGDYGVYYFGISKEGEDVIISSSVDGDTVYPKAIEKNTFIIKSITGKGGDSKNRAQLNFSEKRTETMAKYTLLLPEGDAVSSLQAVKNVALSLVSASADELTINGVFDYGYANDPICYATSDVANFTLTDTDTDTAVTIASIAQSGDDLVLTLTGSVTSNNYSLVINVDGIYTEPLTGVFVGA